MTRLAKGALGILPLLAISVSGFAADPGSTSDMASVRSMATPILLNGPPVISEPMSLTNAKYICGGQVSAGTPIAADADGADGVLGTPDDGNSGVIPLAGIPDGAVIRKAVLFWSVLTDSPEEDNTGMNIYFNGMPIVGTKVGFVAGKTPCFPQDNTVGWKADVTQLVSGNGDYTVMGFPGGNTVGGSDFSEGATLAVLYDDSSYTLRRLVEYEGMAVNNAMGETVHQTLMGFTAGPFPVEATWYPVVGNGQNSADVLSFGPLDFGSTIFDGSTAAFAAETCSLDGGLIAHCFWDDDNVDVSGAFLGGETSVVVVGGTPPSGGDCHSWIAMQLVVSVDPPQFGVFCDEGGRYVDAQCPPYSEYRNHGEYMSCVAAAAEAFLASENILCEEVQSCIVNPRARSDVGKKSKP